METKYLLIDGPYIEIPRAVTLKEIKTILPNTKLKTKGYNIIAPNGSIVAISLKAIADDSPLLDKHIGMPGSEARDLFEQEMREDRESMAW